MDDNIVEAVRAELNAANAEIEDLIGRYAVDVEAMVKAAIETGLRDRFAMHAPSSLLEHCIGVQRVADASYEYADAMMIARKPKMPEPRDESEERIARDTERPPAFAAEESNTLSPVTTVLSDTNELTSPRIGQRPRLKGEGGPV